MAAEPVPPVTDNERDAALIRKVLTVHSGADFLADDFPRLEEGQDAWHALDRLMAALSAATTERVGRLGEADYQRERAEALAAQLQQAREALSWALDSLELAFKRLDSVDEYSPEHYLIRQAGFDKARAALVAAAPATTERHRWPGDPLDGLAGDEVADAEMEFLRASIAVWRSIDERDAMPGGYSAQPLTQDTELRRVERKAWERYRDALGSAAPATTLTEPEGEA